MREKTERLEALYQVQLAKLNPRQKRFVDHLVAGESTAEAARRAGYSQRWARTVGQRAMSTNADILEAVSTGRKLATARSFWSMEDRLRTLAEIGNGKQVVVQPKDGEGKPVTIGPTPRDKVGATREYSLLAGDHPSLRQVGTAVQVNVGGQSAEAAAQVQDDVLLAALVLHRLQPGESVVVTKDEHGDLHEVRPKLEHQLTP